MGIERFNETVASGTESAGLSPAQRESFEGFQNFNTVKNSMTQSSESLPSLQLTSSDSKSPTSQMQVAETANQRGGDTVVQNDQRQPCEVMRPYVPPQQMHSDLADLTRNAVESNRLWEQAGQQRFSGEEGLQRRENYFRSLDASDRRMAETLMNYPPNQMNQVLERLNRNLERQGAQNRFSYDPTTDQVYTTLGNGQDRWTRQVTRSRRQCLLS